MGRQCCYQGNEMESQGEEEESECKSLAMLLELNVVFALL